MVFNWLFVSAAVHEATKVQVITRRLGRVAQTEFTNPNKLQTGNAPVGRWWVYEPQQIEGQQVRSGSSVLKFSRPYISEYIELCIYEFISSLNLIYWWLGVFR